MVKMRQRGNIVLILTVLGLGLLLVISFFSYGSAQKYVASNAVQIQSEKIIALANRIQISIERAETAQRGYLMTLHTPFLDTYREAVDLAKADFKRLMELVSEKEAQEKIFRDLDELILARLGYLQDDIYLAENGRQAEAFERVRSGLGQQTMDQVREAFMQFMNREADLLKSRTAQANRDFKTASLMVLAGLLVAFMLLQAATMTLKGEIGRRKEAEKKAYDASEMKSQFLANMSHEIRTPLNGIIGMTRILSETNLDEEQVEFVHTIRDSSNSLLSLINQILDLSKIESGKLELEETHFELRSLIDSTTSILDFAAKGKGLDVVVNISKDVPDHFIGDPLRVRQILLNLLNNAIKFSSEGQIELRVSSRGVESSISDLLFEVIDQGIGIDKESLSRLFKNFSQGDQSTTRKFGGTGLGLSISKQLVELMGGQIAVESEPQKGSKFFFNLKLKAAKYEPQEEVEFEPVVPKKLLLQGHILIAEDNVTNQRVAGAMLKKMGCAFDCAENGVEALKLLKQKTFDLVMMDGQMPQMDGYETTKRIRSGEAGDTNRKIPILAVTANAIKGDLELCLAAGMDDYVVKPISQDDLQAKIQKWLDQAGRSINMGTLQSLRKLGESAQQDLVKELVEIFTSSAPQILKDFKIYLAKEDYDRINMLAHNFKSTCTNVGATRMRNLTARLEKVKASDDSQSIRKLLDALEQEYGVVSEELKRYVAA